jgi:hypothetical protein
LWRRALGVTVAPSHGSLVPEASARLGHLTNAFEGYETARAAGQSATPSFVHLVRAAGRADHFLPNPPIPLALGLRRHPKEITRKIVDIPRSLIDCSPPLRAGEHRVRAAASTHGASLCLEACSVVLPYVPRKAPLYPRQTVTEKKAYMDSLYADSPAREAARPRRPAKRRTLIIGG